MVWVVGFFYWWDIYEFFNKDLLREILNIFIVKSLCVLMYMGKDQQNTKAADILNEMC